MFEHQHRDDEKSARTRGEYTATIKICECECQCQCGCCIEQLYSAIEDDPKLLQRMNEIQFVHTPLHEAAAAGNTVLALEIMNLMPSLARKLNPKGLSPLHLAVASGNAAAALALVKLDPQLVRIKGRGGLTPLHHAAAGKPSDEKSRLELLARLLVECPESMGVLNNRRQSAVHVAIENENVEATRLLVNWLVIVARESELSTKDAHGNTTLHVAARYCRCRELLEILTKLVKVNKANNYGETPLDIAIHHGNGDAVEMLRSVGAAQTTTTRAQRERRQSKVVLYLLGGHADKCAEMLTRAYFFITKELTMDMRNTILVVAVLIATTTYQGVLQPPGGVYSAEGAPTDRRLLAEHPPGRMVMGTTKYSYFMPTNTLAFVSATLIIIFVLPDRAFIVILQACLIFMCVGYLLALNFISYYNSFSRILDIVCCCTIGVAFGLKLGYYCVKAYYDEEEWLLRRLGVMVSNHRDRFVWCCKRKEGEEMSVIRRMRQQYKLICKRNG